MELRILNPNIKADRVQVQNIPSQALKFLFEEIQDCHVLDATLKAGAISVPLVVNLNGFNEAWERLNPDK